MTSPVRMTVNGQVLCKCEVVLLLQSLCHLERLQSMVSTEVLEPHFVQLLTTGCLSGQVTLPF